MIELTLRAEYHIAVPTAFFKDESLNTQATIDYMVHLKKIEIPSVLVCGTTGEQHSLNLEEKKQLLKAIDEDSRLTKDWEIIFGVASIRQKEAVELIIEVEKNKKINAVLLGFPPYVLPTQQEAINYVKQLAGRTSKPIILYNNPNRTGFTLHLDSALELFRLKNIIGIKEAGDSARIPDLVDKVEKDLFIYAGGEIGLEEKIELGFNRLSSISGNIYPLETMVWFQDLKKGRSDLDSHTHLFEGIKTVFTSDSPLQFIKKSISEVHGIDMGSCRSPIGND